MTPALHGPSRGQGGDTALSMGPAQLKCSASPLKRSIFTSYNHSRHHPLKQGFTTSNPSDVERRLKVFLGAYKLFEIIKV